MLNIYKPRDFTSNDVVQVVKRLTKSKAGHTGTLDPQATGVLPICLGRATKIADYIMNGDKEYIAQVVLGIATDTGDAHGAEIAHGGLVDDKARIQGALSRFVGEINQMPPMYSAIKVGGKKLYQYAREGVMVERKTRQITILQLDVLHWDLPQSFVMRVKCSKGTYIRTLCEDIGVALGTVAHMGKLLRTETGGFATQGSISLAVLEKAVPAGNLGDLLIPIERALAHMPKIYIAEDAQKLLINGNKIPLEYVAGLVGGPSLAFDHTGRLAGIFHADGVFLRPLTMLL
ncbi:MAG: tRNA pseudouridine(55) synthase TruB [Defluviitaleaceae bacterium]|nr:tRNA pseudouridine(55) synthase TruB [Defluviitaleaceae bacterium]